MSSRVSCRRPDAGLLQSRLVCLDIETVPDRARLPASGPKFPKPIYHRIACISMVEARIERDADGGERYHVLSCRSLGDEDWEEPRLIEEFWSTLAHEPTRVVTWNGRGFDIPVLLHRSLVHGLPATAWFTAGTRSEGYTRRYDPIWHCDLMDALSDYGASPKLSLDEAAQSLGLPGKGGGHGSAVEALVEAGRLGEVRAYCEGDCVNLYGLYLRYALLTGRVSPAGHEAAKASVVAYLQTEPVGRPHLGRFLAGWAGIRPQVGKEGGGWGHKALGDGKPIQSIALAVG